MFYHNITHDDMNNGDGLRVVLWVSGCTHHCPECQNPQTWDYTSGIPFDSEALKEILEELGKDYVSGITFSGGDPLAKHNRLSVLRIIDAVKESFPEKTIWMYTGFTYEKLFMSRNYLVYHILRELDVLVDGEYRKDLRDTNLKWRGSSNQRVIDVQKSLKKGEVVLHCE